jgi:uncharacterized coiled-coil DUF342 family protein
MIDASTYFALSDRDRVSYVFANCQIPSGYAPDDITARVEKVMGEVNETSSKLTAQLVTLANDDGTTPQSFVDAAIAAMTETAKQAKEYAVRMEKTAQGLAGLRAADEQQPKSIEALDAERVSLTAEIDRLQGEKARYQAAYELGRTSKRRRDELTTAIRAKAGFVTRRDSVRNEIDAKEHELGQIPAADPAAIEALRSDEREAALALRDYERDLRQVEESITTNERELAGVDAKTSCPYCGAAGDGWKALKSGEITSAIAGLRAKRDQLVEHVGKLKTSAADLLTRFTEGRDAQSARRVLESELVNLRRDLEAAEKQIAVLEGKEQELATIPAEDPAVVAAVETAQTALNVANDALRTLDAQRKAVLGRANDLKRLAEAETARDAARLEETLAKAALEELRTVQRKMVEDAFRPLLTVANSFFGAILKSPLAYNDGEIGTWREGVWVGHRTFSGTEKALCYSAIQMALAASSPVRVMIVDELGRLDAGNAEKLLLAVGHAIKTNRIDQFIGIDATNRYETSGTLEDFAFQLVTVK